MEGADESISKGTKRLMMRVAAGVMGRVVRTRTRRLRQRAEGPQVQRIGETAVARDPGQDPPTGFLKYG